jgi:hypothetical protein
MITTSNMDCSPADRDPFGNIVVDVSVPEAL